MLISNQVLTQLKLFLDLCFIVLSYDDTYLCCIIILYDDDVLVGDDFDFIQPHGGPFQVCC